jgi:hypothetical protein
LGFWILDFGFRIEKLALMSGSERNDCRAPTDPLYKSENIPFKNQKSAIPNALI